MNKSILYIGLFVSVLFSGCRPQVSVKDRFDWSLRPRPYRTTVANKETVSIPIKIESDGWNARSDVSISYYPMKGEGIMTVIGVYDKNRSLVPLQENVHYPLETKYNERYDSDFIVCYYPTSIGEHQLLLRVYNRTAEQDQTLKLDFKVK